MQAMISFSQSSGVPVYDAPLILLSSSYAFYAFYTQQLKISSSKSSWYRVMGYGGNIDIYDTVVRTWIEM